MRKVILLILFLLTITSTQAQKFNIGLGGALPTGEADQFTKFGINADIFHLWTVSEQIDLGVTTGYHHHFGQDVFNSTFGSLTLEDIGFLPIATFARIYTNSRISLGLDMAMLLG
jgi:hypothetical protein